MLNEKSIYPSHIVEFFNVILMKMHSFIKWINNVSEIYTKILNIILDYITAEVMLDFKS